MQRPEIQTAYLLTFTSFYKAMYARDKLMEKGINGELRKAPTQLMRSCGQALYISGYELENVLAVLAESRIEARGIYRAVPAGTGAGMNYQRIARPVIR